MAKVLPLLLWLPFLVYFLQELSGATTRLPGDFAPPGNPRKTRGDKRHVMSSTVIVRNFTHTHTTRLLILIQERKYAKGQ